MCFKAKAYCDAPFEIRHEGGRKVRVEMKAEWIGDEPPLAYVNKGETTCGMN